MWYVMHITSQDSFFQSTVLHRLRESLQQSVQQVYHHYVCFFRCCKMFLNVIYTASVDNATALSVHRLNNWCTLMLSLYFCV